MEDLAQLARDQIERRISSQFSGHAFTQLIAAILAAQGYRAEVSPPGPDKGIDIVAGQGALGLNGPKLVVQVKSGGIVADQPTLQGLIGCIHDVHADHGLLVSGSGFTPPVRKRVNELYFRVRLWDRKEIVEALLAAYDETKDETHVMAFKHTCGDGRVFFLALGHDMAVMVNPSFQQVVRRGALWVGRRLAG